LNGKEKTAISELRRGLGGTGRVEIVSNIDFNTVYASYLNSINKEYKDKKFNKHYSAIYKFDNVLDNKYEISEVIPSKN
jgi:hypothetical protein